MRFIEKLIQDTKNGNLDFAWKYSDGSKTYTYSIPKDPMNGMSLDAKRASNTIIFSNGFGVNFNRKDLNILLDEIDISLERTVATIIHDYTNETSNNTQNDTQTDKNNSDDNINDETKSQELIK
jgi:hypothetical protein